MWEKRCGKRFVSQLQKFQPHKSRLHKFVFPHRLIQRAPPYTLEGAMYEDFHVIDRWTGDDLHCRWRANVVAIATRHADAVDVRYEVNKRPVWIAMPCLAWVEQKKRTGNVITDQLAAQIAGHYLKQAIESGYDNGREMYTMTIDEVLEHLDVVLREAGHTSKLPTLIPLDDAQPVP